MKKYGAFVFLVLTVSLFFDVGLAKEIRAKPLESVEFLTGYGWGSCAQNRIITFIL